MLKYNYYKVFIFKLISNTFSKNFLLKPLDRLSYLAKLDNTNNLYFNFSTYHKLTCLISLSQKVPNKKCNYSRLFLNKQLDKLVISGGLLFISLIASSLVSYTIIYEIVYSNSLITKLNAYFIVDYYVVYEILCKYTKLIIILLCLITLHTNLKLVDDYLLLFSKKINKKIVNKTKKETFNNLEKQEVNIKYISKRVRRDRRSFDCDLDDEYLTESDKFTPKHNYPKSNVEKLLITIILLTFLLLLSAPL